MGAAGGGGGGGERVRSSPLSAPRHSSLDSRVPLAPTDPVSQIFPSCYSLLLLSAGVVGASARRGQSLLLLSVCLAYLGVSFLSVLYYYRCITFFRGGG